MVTNSFSQDIDLDKVLNVALAHHQAGQLDRAAAGYRTVLQFNADEPDALNLLGLILQERGDLVGSVALITRALRIVPEFPEALVNLARAQCAAGIPEEAADLARRAVTLDPNFAEAHLQLGHALIRMGDDAGAIVALRQSATLCPQVPETLLLLGNALMRLHEYDDAAASLAEVLALDPARADAKGNLVLVLTRLAQAHQAAGDGQAAAEAARRALALDPAILEVRLELADILLAQHEDLLTDDPAAAMEAATSHHKAERLDRAEAIYRALLRRNPDHPPVLHLLGLLLLDQGRPADALPLLTRFLAMRPDVALVQTALARAQRSVGNAQAAAEAAQRAVELDPALPEALLELGHAMLVQRQGGAAVEAFRRAVAIAPRVPEAHIALATALTHCDDHKSAVLSWQAAAALKPADPNVLIGLAGTLSELARFDEALAAYRQAEAMVPGHPHVRHGVAKAIARNGDFSVATEICIQALETSPEYVELWLLLGYCQSMQGRFEAASKSYRSALALDPGSAGALHDLVALGGQPDDDAAKDAARGMLEDLTRPAPDRIAAAFALAKICDRSGEDNEAFAAYATANRLLRADRTERGAAFDRSKFRALIDWVIATFDPDMFENMSGMGNLSELPVFIVGMPRSGTSLVEQIAASHKLVFGGGERTDIFGMIVALGGDRTAWSPAEWQHAAVRHETLSYLGRLGELSDDAARITDKLPDNILCLGQITLLFPRARIVVCQRDPRDVGLSCFFQYFRESSMAWSDDLADCGFRARQIDRLMEHWRRVLPTPVLEMQYESLVHDPEHESRRLIDFLGLDWDPACLNFHQTARPVKTASYLQVRQPLYMSSIGRWRRFERYLEPFLQEFHCLEDDESGQSYRTIL